MSQLIDGWHGFAVLRVTMFGYESISINQHGYAVYRKAMPPKTLKSGCDGRLTLLIVIGDELSALEFTYWRAAHDTGPN